MEVLVAKYLEHIGLYAMIADWHSCCVVTESWTCWLWSRGSTWSCQNPLIQYWLMYVPLFCQFTEYQVGCMAQW